MAITDIPQSLPDLRVEQLKNRFSSLTPEQMKTLRLCYVYRLRQAGIRSNGWLNLLLGSLTLWLAIPSAPSNNAILNALLTLQAIWGAGIVLVSIWSIVSPAPIGSIAWAAVFGIAGLWNLFLFFFGHNVFVGVLGLFQLWWAYRRVRLYRQDAKTVWPSSESLRLYDELQRGLQSYQRTNENDPDYIQLRYRGLVWHGFLLENSIVLASQRGVALLLAERSKALFTFVDAKNPSKKQLSGAFSLDGMKGPNVTFPRLTFERYNRWRSLPTMMQEELARP